jgi:protein-S-isoprenylcysteine O-methyltransferase Ste14
MSSWVVGVALVHIAVPAALSRCRRRHGWRRGRPGPANLFAAVPLLGGLAVVAWALGGHYRSAPNGGFAVSLEPEYLLRQGPYRFSRNPMYVGEAGMWLGWAGLLGSVPVAVGFVVLMAGARHAVLREEQTLHRRFGEDWQAYAADVPRWLGKASG